VWCHMFATLMIAVAAVVCFCLVEEVVCACPHRNPTLGMRALRSSVICEVPL
jgi:hypothetical protein